MTADQKVTAIASRGGADRSIGAILIDSGKLRLADAERIMHLQKEEGLRFGDAAIRLGLVTREDIDRAVAHQFEYPYLVVGESDVSHELVAAYQPFSPEVEALRALRSQLMLRWFTEDNRHKTLAVCSAESAEGRSWMAANLAIVFSQLGERTLLIDADLRNPRQHDLFKLENGSGLSSILSNRGDIGAIRRIPSFIDLSVLPAGPIPPNPQELLGRSAFAQLLDEVSEKFDVVIIDSPSGKYADVQTVAVRAGGALLLARKHFTAVADLGSLANNLRQTGAQVVGVVVSEF
jgi:receptor protein-tyrosine kinase